MVKTMIRLRANKANRDGKDNWNDSGFCDCRARNLGHSGGISLAGIAGQKRYAHYGDRSSDLSSGLPHDTAAARQFFDPSLQAAWISLKKKPYDFLVQSTTWKLGAISIAIL